VVVVVVVVVEARVRYPGVDLYSKSLPCCCILHTYIILSRIKASLPF
jgi:hypothetical protein